MPITTVGPDHDSHRHPRFLPDGKRFIFIARAATSGQANSVFLASLDTTVAPRIIAETQAHADYVGRPPADRARGRPDGDALRAGPGAGHRGRHAAGGEHPGAAGRRGGGVHARRGRACWSSRPGPRPRPARCCTWTDIENGGMQALGEPGQIFHPVISPDGTRAVVEVRDASNEGTDLWLVDLETGLRTALHLRARRRDHGRAGRATASSSSTSPASDGIYRIVQQPVEGQGGAAIVLESAREIAPTSLGAEDRDLLVDFEREDGNFEMRRLSLAPAAASSSTVATVADGNLGGGTLLAGRPLDRLPHRDRGRLGRLRHAGRRRRAQVAGHHRRRGLSQVEPRRHASCGSASSTATCAPTRWTAAGRPSGSAASASR